MDDILSKLSSYNIVNYLFPGTLFVAFTDASTSFSFVQERVIVSLFWYYFIGLAISRFGSLVLEPLLLRTRFLKFAKYRDYVMASRDDNHIVELSGVNNMYRTLCALFVVLIAFVILDRYPPLSSHLSAIGPYLTCLGFLAVFLFAYRKQTQYVVRRIEVATRDKE